MLIILFKLVILVKIIFIFESLKFSNGKNEKIG